MFNRKRAVICLGINILLTIILSGCGDEEVICLYDEIVPMEEVIQEENAECEKVGIYIDSTPSMEGYIGWHESLAGSKYPNALSSQEKDYKKCVPMTTFNQCLDVINNVMASQYDEGNIKYYSINTTLWESRSNVLEEAVYRTYYGDSNDKNDSDEEGIKYVMVEEYAEKYSDSYDNPSISYAIEKAMQDDFAVIITDLYENERNADDIIYQLKKIKEQKDYKKGIGLIGIPSEFAGIIYDLPGDTTMNYGIVSEHEKFTSEDVCFRPFYILLIGNNKQIDNFIHEFEENIGEIKINKCIWSNQKISGLDYRDYAEYKINGLYEMPTMEIGIRNKINGEKLKQKVAEIHESKIEQKEKIYLFYNVDSVSLENFLRRNSNNENMEICVNDEEITVVKVDGFEINSACLYQYDGEDTKTEVSSEIQKAIGIEAIYWSRDRGQVVVELKLEKSRITSGIYVFNADINKNIEDIVPKWIEDWNLPIDVKDGSKTQNLRNVYVAVNNAFLTKEQKILKMQFYFRMEG